MADVVFFAEQRDGTFRRTAFEAATAAKRLADALGGKTHGVVIGDGVSGIASELGTFGAAEVHVVEDGELARLAPRAYAEAVAQVATKVSRPP